MAKSKLTTAEIATLSATETYAAIAEKSGTTAQAVHARLNIEKTRRAGTQRYRGFSDIQHRAYIVEQRARANAYQLESLRHATRHKVPYSPEEKAYIHTNAETLTAVEIAIALGRTYFSIAGFVSDHKIKMRKG